MALQREGVVRKVLMLLALVVSVALLVGCPGHGNLKHGHVPPGKYKKKP